MTDEPCGDFFHSFSWQDPPPRPDRPDIITLTRSRRRSPRVYRDLLLHELGHYVAFYDPGLRDRMHLHRYNLGVSTVHRGARISLLKEEMIAWDIGAWVAESLGITLDRWYWARRTRCIESYMHWALRRG